MIIITRIFDDPATAQNSLGMLQGTCSAAPQPHTLLSLPGPDLRIRTLSRPLRSLLSPPARPFNSSMLPSESFRAFTLKAGHQELLRPAFKKGDLEVDLPPQKWLRRSTTKLFTTPPPNLAPPTWGYARQGGESTLNNPPPSTVPQETCAGWPACKPKHYRPPPFSCMFPRLGNYMERSKAYGTAP